MPKNPCDQIFCVDIVNFKRLAFRFENKYLISVLKLSLQGKTITGHADLTILSIFQKTVIFDHNLTLLHNFIAFNLKYFLLAYTFRMKKYKINKFVSLKTVEL